jgi:outer membrane receptor protein involved in Fe transport
VFSNIDIRLGIQNVFNKRPGVDLVNFASVYSQSGDPRQGLYWLSIKKSMGR